MWTRNDSFIKPPLTQAQFQHAQAHHARTKIVAGPRKRALANRISGLNSFLMHSFPMQQLFLAFHACATVLCPKSKSQITKCAIWLLGYLWIILNCIIGSCPRDAGGVQSPNIRRLCTLFNQFKFRKPQSESDPERASTALHGAVAALNGAAGDGAARRRSAFRTMLYSTAAIERSTNGEGQRAEAGEGDRERNGGGQTEAERRQECTIQFERRSRSGRSSVASIPHRLRTPSENWTADIRGLWCEAYLPYRQAYNYESTASCEHT